MKRVRNDVKGGKTNNCTVCMTGLSTKLYGAPEMWNFTLNSVIAQKPSGMKSRV